MSEPLYAKLPPGPTGLGREQVSEHQQTRLRKAMVQAACSRGYTATTVAELIALAGVSRRTFYEHFDSKEACFLATYDAIVSRGTDRILAAYRRQPDVFAGLAAAYETFVDELVADPQAARLVIAEVFAVGPGALGQVERMRQAFEQKLSESLDQRLRELPLAPTVPKGILSGAWQVARLRLLGDRLEELRDIGGELAMWALTYNSPAAELLAPRTDGQALGDLRLPRPRHERSDQQRILRTAAQLAAVHGYTELTPALIMGEARVPFETFFECFEDTKQCLLAALELLATEALAFAYRKSQEADDWAAAVQKGLEAALYYVAYDQTFAGVAFIEVFSTGSAGLQLRERLLARVAELLVRGAPISHRPSSVVAEAIVGAVWGLVYEQVVRGEAHRLPELVEYAAYLTLAPLLGAEGAVERIISSRSEPRTSVREYRNIA